MEKALTQASMPKEQPAFLNKSFITNATAAFVVILGYVAPWYNEVLKNTGYFALSGAITNWLAIYMLFEKVPYLYGSGVIPRRFEEFKLGIRQLIMNQFFTEENIDRFLSQQAREKEDFMNLDPILDAVNYDLVFEKLVQAVMATPLGGLLAMAGGPQALNQVKAPFQEKIREAINDIWHDANFQNMLRHNFATTLHSSKVVPKIAGIVENRLNELTPELVKEIIQGMIRQHLGWLVVWGGVFGGLIGMIASWL